MATSTQPTNIVTPGQVAAVGGWSYLFGNDRPLNLEIGIGGGEFLEALSAGHPDENFVGLDISGVYLRKAARRAERHGSANVRFMNTEAKAALYEIFGHETLAAVYVNFPDPWPKKGHSKRRLFDRAFVELLEDRLEPEGLVYLGTDVLAYAEEAYAVLSASALLVNAYSTPWKQERGWNGLETKYERKWREAGKQLYYLAFRKTRGLRTPRYEIAIQPFAPIPLGTRPETTQGLVEALQSPAEPIGKYLVKCLMVRPSETGVHAKILLIDKVMGFGDYLHAQITRHQRAWVFDVTNCLDFVYTESKHRALMRYLERVSR